MSKNKRGPEHLSYDNGDNNVKKKRQEKGGKDNKVRILI